MICVLDTRYVLSTTDEVHIHATYQPDYYREVPTYQPENNRQVPKNFVPLNPKSVKSRIYYTPFKYEINMDIRHDLLI
jgi:hypothetical protein